MQKDNFHVRQVRVEVEGSHEADKPLAKSHVDHAGKTFTNTDESWLEHAPRRLSFAKACFGRPASLRNSMRISTHDATILRICRWRANKWFMRPFDIKSILGNALQSDMQFMMESLEYCRQTSFHRWADQRFPVFECNGSTGESEIK